MHAKEFMQQTFKFIRFLFLPAIWLILSSLSSIGIVYLTEYYLDVVAIIVFTSCSACASIVSAISVNLFTTNIRAMATCCIFMFGRLGGFVGSNLVAQMLENNCTTIFYIYAVLLIICIGVFVMVRPYAKRVWMGNSYWLWLQKCWVMPTCK